MFQALEPLRRIVPTSFLLRAANPSAMARRSMVIFHEQPQQANPTNPLPSHEQSAPEPCSSYQRFRACCFNCLPFAKQARSALTRFILQQSKEQETQPSQPASAAASSRHDSSSESSNPPSILQNAVQEVFTAFDKMSLSDSTMIASPFFAFVFMRVSGVLRGIFSIGFEHPSVIQQKAIVPIANGRDVIVQAQVSCVSMRNYPRSFSFVQSYLKCIDCTERPFQSGTGKTGAYSIGILQSIGSAPPSCQALILSPTRELAQQTDLVIGRLLCDFLHDWT